MNVGVRRCVGADISEPPARFGVRKPWRQTVCLSQFHVFEPGVQERGAARHTIIDSQQQILLSKRRRLTQWLLVKVVDRNLVALLSWLDVDAS